MPLIYVLSILVVVFDRFSINVLTMNIEMSDDEKDFGICKYCEDERGLCDGIFLDDDRCFSISWT